VGIKDSHLYRGVAGGLMCIPAQENLIHTRGYVQQRLNDAIHTSGYSIILTHPQKHILRAVFRLTFGAVTLEAKTSGPLYLKSASHPSATSVSCKMSRQCCEMFLCTSGDRCNCSRMVQPPPPHFGRQVTAFLNQYFKNLWIGRQGPVAWPPTSPDLTPLGT
jgi:hypothetical protein